MSRETLAELIEQHRLVVVTGGTAAGSQWICECGAQQLNPGARDHARRMHAQHVAHHLADHVRAKQAEAVEEIAREWQFGGWTALSSIPTAGALPALHYGQIVTDWLRDRADRLRDGEA